MAGVFKVEAVEEPLDEPVIDLAQLVHSDLAADQDGGHLLGGFDPFFAARRQP